ncbi:MAG: hypothetical protein CL555_06100 [Algoriphagus sp.]|nr:hypothetical protein [Algoriphagus sp.]QDP64469.1 MAG: hypothetical protein Tp156MES38741_60 [Prokaryotic dsDNA virus sp.]
MFDAAFASIAVGFADRFGAPFVDAVAWWPGTPVKDAGGSIISPGTPVEVACKAQFDAPTIAMRQAEGFTEQDARILVLGFSATLDDKAEIRVASGDNAGQWRLLTVTRDPAGVGYECRARRK